MVRITKMDARVVLAAIDVLQASGPSLDDVYNATNERIHDTWPTRDRIAFGDGANFKDLNTLKQSLIQQLTGVGASTDVKETLIERLADIFSYPFFKANSLTWKDIYLIRKALLRDEEMDKITAAIGKGVKCTSCGKNFEEFEAITIKTDKNHVTSLREPSLFCLQCRKPNLVRCEQGGCKKVGFLSSFAKRYLTFNCGGHYAKKPGKKKVEDELDSGVSIVDVGFEDAGDAANSAPYQTTQQWVIAPTLQPPLNNQRVAVRPNRNLRGILGALGGFDQ